MLLSICSKPLPERVFADSQLASHVGDRATGVDDHASGFFTEFWTKLAILSRHDDFSFPEWNLFGPQSGRWEARHSANRLMTGWWNSHAADGAAWAMIMG